MFGFTKAIEKTRHSINNRLDTIFEGRKQIDEAFLDELEEMLISTDIGVATTMQVLEAFAAAFRGRRSAIWLL